jgi:hypothetical protein
VAALLVVIAVIAAFCVTPMRVARQERRMHAFRENTGERSRANLPLNASNHRLMHKVRDFVCNPLRLDPDFAQHAGRRDDKPTVMQSGFLALFKTEWVMRLSGHVH